MHSKTCSGAICLRLPVGFHAIAWQTGCGAPREARVVLLPEFQGAGYLVVRSSSTGMHLGFL